VTQIQHPTGSQPAYGYWGTVDPRGTVNFYTGTAPYCGGANTEGQIAYESYYQNANCPQGCMREIYSYDPSGLVTSKKFYRPPGTAH
jgi:hypothetical protein